MNKLFLLVGVLAIGCGDDTGDGTECGSGTTAVGGECVADAVCGAGTVLTAGMCLPDNVVPPKVFTQIEHLARPGIAEALLLTDGFLAGYNATAPTFTGVPTDVLNLVVGEAKTVLKAIYLGSCLVSGVLGLTAGANGTALKPGLVPCATVGGDLFTNGNPLTGTTLTTATAEAAQAYADRMFAQFVPDVMRIDTAIVAAPAQQNDYLTPCGDPTAPLPLLCGGRRLDDDVIDVTYNYLIGGLAGTGGAQNDGLAGQVRALTSDGVAYASGSAAGAGNNKNGLTNGVPGNAAQGHPAILAVFPYSAAPF